MSRSQQLFTVTAPAKPPAYQHQPPAYQATLSQALEKIKQELEVTMLALYLMINEKCALAKERASSENLIGSLKEQLKTEKTAHEITKTRLVASQDRIAALEIQLANAHWREAQKLFSYSHRSKVDRASAKSPAHVRLFDASTQAPSEPGYYIDKAVWQSPSRN